MSFESINPADESVIARYDGHSDSDVDQILQEVTPSTVASTGTSPDCKECTQTLRQANTRIAELESELSKAAQLSGTGSCRPRPAS